MQTEMDNTDITDTGTSLVLIAITIFLKLLSILTAYHIIIFLTIISLIFTIIYHGFGIYERFKHFKENRRKEKLDNNKK